MLGDELNPEKAVVGALFDAINERRFDDLGVYLGADVVDENKGFLADEAGAHLPFDGIAAQLAAFDAYQVEVEELIAEGPRVVAIVIQSGIPHPGSRRFVNHAVYIFTVSEGKIRRVRAVSDGSEAGE